MAASSSSSNVRGLEETDDGWVLLPPVAANKPRTRDKPPRTPPPRPHTTTPSPSTSTASGYESAFDPAPDDIVGRYLPLRRALRCDGLPRQIHDADVYGAHHPAFLAAVYPPANDRFERLFFACRGREHAGGRQRRAGPGAYRLASETKLPGLGGSAYCHAFRYYEDAAGSSGSETAKETEWRMDEFCDDHRGSASGAAFDMVVCKVYTARGGAVHRRLQLASHSHSRRDANNNKPQVLVQLYLDSLKLGDPRRCRMHAMDDVFVCGAHPAVLTAAFPVANDRCEWFFAAPRRKRAANGDEEERPRRAGPGAYVPVREFRVAKSGEDGDVGYRRVFRYRDDDSTLRRVSRTEWWMEEYGFGKDFPYGDLPGVGDEEEEELVVYKLYMKMAGDRA
ncbi:uncharacterized protein LOC100837354 [Brachypodium distachyon]|uniref:NAC domain-containing protein n=1 Tax=Brachypodium distachyon TaxID=15368 RepID=I1IZH7_BRADI|nr:uncharacterized protein LOC100837354 [Brachypodium distachyon]KQJ83490.1 hypothetical protein BRADI_5g15230v3 [Brachypodium distachyon]|eukprot:XP_003581408.1 uncharacterized protein LOC100837354 [Brachypodium distachyon]